MIQYRKNLIINGGFDIWQRATDSGSNTTDGYLSADRWKHASSGATKDLPVNLVTSIGADVAAVNCVAKSCAVSFK